MVITHDFGKLLVVLDEMRAGADDAHFATENVEKLGEFVDAKFPKQGAHGKNPRVAARGLLALGLIMHIHGAVFFDDKSAILHSGAFLPVEQRSGSLEPMENADKKAGDGEDENADGKSDGDVEGTFKVGVDDVFQGFFAQGKKPVVAIGEVLQGVAKFILDVAVNQDSHPETFAELDEVFVKLGEKGQFGEDDEVGLVDLEQGLGLFDGAEHAEILEGGTLGVVGNDADGFVTELALFAKPVFKLYGVLHRADENGAVGVAVIKSVLGDKTGEDFMGQIKHPKQDDHIDDEKRSRNGEILGEKEKKSDRSHNVKNLAGGAFDAVGDAGFEEFLAGFGFERTLDEQAHCDENRVNQIAPQPEPFSRPEIHHDQGIEHDEEQQGQQSLGNHDHLVQTEYALVQHV